MSAIDDINNKQKDLDAANSALDSGKKSYTYKGKSYDLTKLRDDLIPQLEQEIDSLKSQQTALGGAKWIAELALSEAQSLERQIVKKFKDKKATAQEVETAQSATSDAQKVLDRVNKGELSKIVLDTKTNKYAVQFVAPTGEPLPTQTQPTTAERQVGSGLAREGGTAKVKPAKVRQIDSVETIVENGNNVEVTTYDDKTSTRKILGKAPEGTEDTPASDVFKTTAITKESAASRKQYVDEQLKAQGLTDTPENRATLRKDYQTKQIAAPTNWEADLRTYMPAKTWMLELDRTKYPQLFDLLQRASDQNYYSTPEGQKRFLGELDGTDYFKEIADSSQRRDIKKLVGDLGFDSTDFSKFVTDSINFGWEGDTLKAKTYEEVFRKNVDGTYANPTAVTRATKSNDYLNKQLIAKSYFNQAPQATIEKILTGGITVEDFQRQQRTMAKQRYGHLSELIDQGVTLEDLASNYKTSAAKLLEIDPNTIDMSESDFEIALSYGEEGKKRAMTTGEWEKMLRTDQRYGWEKTNNAKAEARSLASNIAQAFGRII